MTYHDVDEEFRREPIVGAATIGDPTGRRTLPEYAQARHSSAAQ